MLHNFHKHLVSMDPVCSRDKITMVATEEYELDSHHWKSNLYKMSKNHEMLLYCGRGGKFEFENIYG